MTEQKDKADVIDEHIRKYNNSPKGKEARKRWQTSSKGKVVLKQRSKKLNYKLMQQKYRSSPKGKETASARRETDKVMQQAFAWLQANPGKSLNDYIAMIERKGADNEQ